jgi:hypothetical protein
MDAIYNVKYLSSDHRKEVIINFSNPKNPVVVTDPYNMGTYNYGTNYITHFAKDMLPYYLWGNSEVDSDVSFLWNRIVGASK